MRLVHEDQVSAFTGFYRPVITMEPVELKPIGLVTSPGACSIREAQLRWVDLVHPRLDALGCG
jgi:hypothetical protein